MWTSRELAAVASVFACVFGCEGPRVGPPLDGGASFCEDYCSDATGCDRDCVHACNVNLAICPDEWGLALGCGADKRCDAEFGLPVASEGCDDEFMTAGSCASHGSCSAESSFELCDGCCAGYERYGAQAWQFHFHDCACRNCATDCGFLCDADSGSELACQSCTAAFCGDEVTRACAAEPDCRRYDLCAMGCPIDASSNCNEHPTSNACRDCCARDFREGAARYDEVRTGCACSACLTECLDSDLCQGFDIEKPSCGACIESICEPTLVSDCGSESACGSFMACVAGCPAD